MCTVGLVEDSFLDDVMDKDPEVEVEVTEASRSWCKLGRGIGESLE